MAKTVASRKAKGRRGQQEIIDKLLATFPELTTNDLRSIPGSVPGPDVWMSEAAQKILPYDIESKNVEKLNIWAALEQVVSRGSEKLTPLLIFKRNNSKTYACLDFDDFLKLLKQANSTKESA